ncbi:S26 family signal peptidase [Halovivax cerinus]|uniref:S26 family signal peptidase n=1 Tax=Halovivax cerinus TaxID=1487865 RepID=A0ABD5NTS7_9EURY|nr:S26 family signal peptidase [Halovivax cerinus]
MVGARLQRVLLLVVGIVVCTLLLGQLLGQPILLGFVETGSMQPSLEPGDGFVAIPAVVADDPEPGDVVVFDARTIQGGGLTTHRIVDETDAGYVTHGDANPFTDQDGGEPPVQDSQIVATVWQVDGEIVSIPSLGTASTSLTRLFDVAGETVSGAVGARSAIGSTGAAVVVFVLSTLWYGIELVRERGEPRETSRFDGGERERLDPRYICVGFTLLVLVAAAAAMFVPAGATHYDIVSAEFDSEDETVIRQGTTQETGYAVANGGFVPIVSYVDSGEYVRTPAERTTVGPRSESEIPIAITAPDETGFYPTSVTEYRYLQVVPPSAIDALYDVHPNLPHLVILGLLGGATYGLGRVALGRTDTRPRRRRSTRTERSRRGVDRR